MICFLVEFGTGLTVWYLFVFFHFTTKCDSISLYYSAHRFIYFFCASYYVCTFWVACCDVCYDFRIKTMFGSSLPPVVCRRAHVLFTLFVFVWYSGVQHILCCVFGLFFLVLCTLCCHFLFDCLLPLRYSLTFMSYLDPHIHTIHKKYKRTTNYDQDYFFL